MIYSTFSIPMLVKKKKNVVKCTMPAFFTESPFRSSRSSSHQPVIMKACNQWTIRTYLSLSLRMLSQISQKVDLSCSHMAVKIPCRCYVRMLIHDSNRWNDGGLWKGGESRIKEGGDLGLVLMRKLQLLFNRSNVLKSQTFSFGCWGW